MPTQPSTSPGIKWNQVTWYSKLGAIILFIGVVPALTFYIGTQYQLAQQSLTTPFPAAQIASTKTAVPQQASSSVAALYVDPQIENTLQNCLQTPAGETTVGGDGCSSAALSSYESAESAQYTALETRIKTNLQISEIDPQYYTDAVSSLSKAESTWNSYRGSICSVVSDFWTTGTGSGGAYVSCEITLTQKHIQDLITTGSDW